MVAFQEILSQKVTVVPDVDFIRMTVECAIDNQETELGVIATRVCMHLAARNTEVYTSYIVSPQADRLLVNTLNKSKNGTITLFMLGVCITRLSENVPRPDSGMIGKLFAGIISTSLRFVSEDLVQTGCVEIAHKLICQSPLSHEDAITTYGVLEWITKMFAFSNSATNPIIEFLVSIVNDQDVATRHYFSLVRLLCKLVYANNPHVQKSWFIPCIVNLATSVPIGNVTIEHFLVIMTIKAYDTKVVDTEKALVERCVDTIVRVISGNPMIPRVTLYRVCIPCLPTDSVDTVIEKFVQYSGIMLAARKYGDPAVSSMAGGCITADNAKSAMELTNEKTQLMIEVSNHAVPVYQLIMWMDVVSSMLFRVHEDVLRFNDDIIVFSSSSSS